MKPNFLRHFYPESAKLLGGRYRIKEQLGTGGFGHTFLAQDLHLPGDPYCALKQLKPQIKTPQDLKAAERLFEKEAQALYQLGHHPQIPRLLAHFKENQEFYLAQELIEGESLEAELKQQSPWDDVQVIDFLSDLLSTLAFIHEHHVIHRDLKPSNLIRKQSDRRIVVIDFGAVKQVSLPLAVLKSTLSHTISIGTQGYMPNEQLAGHPYFRSDIYAVGMIAIQALTGQHPATIRPHPQTGELDWHGLAPHSAPHLTAFLDYLTRYDFRSRYDNATEALAALQSLSISQAPTPPALGLNLNLNRQLESSEFWSALSEVQVSFTNHPSSVFKAQTLPLEMDLTETQTQKEESKAARLKKPQKLAFPFAGLLLGVGLLAWRTNVSTFKVKTANESLGNPTAPSAQSTATPIGGANLPNSAVPSSLTPSRPLPKAQTTASPKTKSSKAYIAKISQTDLDSGPLNLTGTLAVDAAQDLVDELYEHILNKDWNAARSLFEGSLAEQFEPGFYQQFRQVTVDGYRVMHRSAQSIDLAIKNTYVYLDGSTQQEERTYKVQVINSRPYITHSAFIRVIKARNE